MCIRDRELYVFRGHAKEVCSLAWHPVHHDLLASGGSDGSLLHWSLRASNPTTPLHTSDEAHESNIWGLAWHPRGHMLASGSNDHSTRFWSRSRPGENTQEDAKGEQQEERWDEWGDDAIPGLARR